MLKVRAVYDDSLVVFLKKLGLFQAVSDGSLKCHNCHKTVDLESFGSVKRMDGKLIVFCNRPSCVAHSLQEK